VNKITKEAMLNKCYFVMELTGHKKKLKKLKVIVEKSHLNYTFKFTIKIEENIYRKYWVEE
jgi:hypothetical protein